mmetsp:Transcript_77814/g.210379  ORF Transcript_77814/g.210379 Transcript_77814/m.210379 type:complete len:218 (-) Transcript_77814:52-705(-)
MTIGVLNFTTSREQDSSVSCDSESLCCRSAKTEFPGCSFSTIFLDTLTIVFLTPRARWYLTHSRLASLMIRPQARKKTKFNTKRKKHKNLQSLEAFGLSNAFVSKSSNSAISWAFAVISSKVVAKMNCGQVSFEKNSVITRVPMLVFLVVVLFRMWHPVAVATKSWKVGFARPSCASARLGTMKTKISSRPLSLKVVSAKVVHLLNSSLLSARLPVP